MIAPAKALPGILFSLFTALLVPAGAGQAEEDEPAKQIGFALEGAFESHEIARTAEGAVRTLVVPFYEWDYGVRSFTAESWRERGMNWEKVRSLALPVAEKLVESVEPDIVRDERGIIDYIILVDPSPFLTSALLTPELWEKYRDSLGDRIFALPIDRNRIYLFPVTGGSLEDYGPSIVDEFRAAPLPISLEVFLLDENGYRAVGEISRKGS